MSTQSYSSVFSNSATANFRIWSSELSSKLQLAGLVKSGDTGQINFLTVSKSGSTNTASGYEIYYLNDSLHATNPLYLKIEYGNGLLATTPQMWITVGTGSNGSGTITGVQSTRTTFLNGGNISSLVTNYSTNICVAEGFLGIQFKSGASSTTKGYGFVSVTRSVDDTGSITGNNAIIYRYTSGTVNFYVTVIDFVNSLVYSEFTDGSYAVIAGNVSSSLVGIDFQAYRHFVPTPRVRPVFSHLTVLQSEVSVNATFSLIPVGSSTSHTYICLGPSASIASINQSSNTNLCMLWE